MPLQWSVPEDFLQGTCSTRLPNYTDLWGWMSTASLIFFGGMPSLVVGMIASCGHRRVTCFTNGSGSWGCGHIWWSSSLSVGMASLMVITSPARRWCPCCWRLPGPINASDITATVSAITKPGSTCDPILVHLSRCLNFLTAAWSFNIEATYVPGKCNNAADTLPGTSSTGFLLLFCRQRLAHLTSLLPCRDGCLTQRCAGHLPSGDRCEAIHTFAAEHSWGQEFYIVVVRKNVLGWGSLSWVRVGL